MCLNSTIYFAVKNKALVPNSAAKDSTYTIIFAIVKIGPFQRGMGSFLDINIWSPALLLDFFSLLKPVSECSVRIISLYRYNMPSSGYEAQ